MLKVIGSGLSPFARKVRVALIEKGLDYEHDPVIPQMNPPAGFEKISPLGKIPVLQDGDFTVPDSSVILAYLERSHPRPSLYPADPREYARALWYEEYADTKLLEATAQFFVQNLVNKKFLNQPADEAELQRARDAGEQAFPYLESQLTGGEYIVGSSFSVADIAIASQFVNFEHGQGRIDPDRFPRLVAYVVTHHARLSFKTLIAEEKAGIPA